MKEFIKENYANMSYKQMAKELDTTINVISNHVKELLEEGKIIRKSKRWTEKEDDYLIKNYKILRTNILAEKFDVSQEIIRNRYYNLTNGKLGLRKIEKRRLLKEKEEEAKMTKLYNEIISKKETLQGLKLDKLNLKKGQTYEITLLNRKGPRKFTGKFEQECDRHVVFRHKKGWCESFLKADLLIDHKYKEVN